MPQYVSGRKFLKREFDHTFGCLSVPCCVEQMFILESQTYSSEDTTTVTLRAQIVDFFISAIITVALKEVIIATEIGPFLNFFSKKVLDCLSIYFSR